MHCSCSLCAHCCEKRKWMPWIVLLFLRRGKTTKDFLQLGMSCFGLQQPLSSKEEHLEKLDVQFGTNNGRWLGCTINGSHALSLKLCNMPPQICLNYPVFFLFFVCSVL